MNIKRRLPGGWLHCGRSYRRVQTIPVQQSDSRNEHPVRRPSSGRRNPPQSSSCVCIESKHRKYPLTGLRLFVCFAAAVAAANEAGSKDIRTDVVDCVNSTASHKDHNLGGTSKCVTHTHEVRKRTCKSITQVTLRAQESVHSFTITTHTITHTYTTTHNVTINGGN